MLFIDAVFVPFLIATLAAYWLARDRWRVGILTAASLVFYATNGAVNAVLFVLCLLAQYVLSGFVVRRHRWALVAAILVALGPLAYYKYAAFIAANINAGLAVLGLRPRLSTGTLGLPIGISFYSFQLLALQVDLFRAEVVRPGLLRLVAFISFFPQLVAGPIVRGRELLPQLCRSVEWVPHSFIDGLTRFIWGLLKKRVVADSMAPAVAWLFDDGHYAGGFIAAACGVSAYAVQIYFDFSAYSDMAIGLGRMFGLEIPENFRQPYGSCSITEFWRRWHVTLSRWLRDYLYIPLGGNRRGPLRQQLNLAITMLLGGLWHGANWTFVVWGAWHGAWLLIEARTGLREADRRTRGRLLPAALATGRTMAIVLVGWVVFRAPDLATAGGILWSLSGSLGMGNPGAVPKEALVAPLVLLATIVKHGREVASPYTLLAGGGEYGYARGVVFALAVVLLLVFAAPTSTFIYWQF